MKIALVTDWYLPRLGGIERATHDLATHLSAAGHHVVVITPTRGESSIEKGLEVRRIRALPFPKFHFIFTPTAFARLRHEIVGGGFDVVHVHLSVFAPTAFAAVYFSKNAALPVVITAHSIFGIHRWFLRITDVFFRWSRWPVVFGAVSRYVAKQWSGYTPIEEVAILPNGLNAPSWQHSTQRNHGESLDIVTTMRLMPKKRPLELVDIFGKVCSRLNDKEVRLHIIGDGPLRKRMERHVHRLKLNDRVQFYGACGSERIREIYRTCDVFAMASKLESFGIAALEARAFGLPIVAMNHNGISDFVRNGIEGILADTDQEFEEALVEILENESLRSAIAENNRNVPPPFAWGDVLKLHLAAYAQAIQAISAPRWVETKRAI